MNHMRRGAALLTVAALLCSLSIPVSAETNTFTIGSVQELVVFSRNCTRDVWSQGITVELTADLDLGHAEFTPIPIFQGTFHGNGHTISGITLAKKGSKVGLFRTLTQSAVVEDLNIDGTLIPKGSACQAGLLAGENYGTIRRCTVRGTVEAQEDTGGLVGFNSEEGQIFASSNEASITGTANVGGIAGQNMGLIDGCSNSGSLNTLPDHDAPTNVGGIAGLSRGTIQNCSNTGDIGYPHVGYNMGGIAGLQSGEISNCTSSASIQGRKDVGAIVGQFEPNTSLTYGPSPSEQLSNSLSGLFKQLERFTDQLSGIVTQGVDDVQAIQDSLIIIQDRAHAAGTEGHEDFQAMSDQLYEYNTAISDNLDILRDDWSTFRNDTSDRLQDVLDQTDRLLSALGDLAEGADSGLGQAIKTLEQTVSGIRSQVHTISSHQQAMSQELKALAQYVSDVAELIAAGEWEQALQIPFPSLDLDGHVQAIANAQKKLAQLVADLPSRWKTIYEQTSQSMNAACKDISKALDDLYDTLTKINQAGDQFSSSAHDSLDLVSENGDNIRDLLKQYTDTLGDKAQSAVDDIDRELTAIQDRVSLMTQATEADNQALNATSHAILDQMDAVRQAISDLSQEPEITVTDLTDELDHGPGLVMGCRASGTVDGDSNVGGIVGTVSPELGDDPEATFDPGDLELMSDVYATLKAVVRDCRFDGSITVKNECGGGIAGRCEAGALVDCAARGTVETGSDYCGGIVGLTRGKVIRCAALTDLTGEGWLGGVAGLGEDITDCRTMIRAYSNGEYLGAIAGQSEGTLTGNRYLMEDLAGLDSVDYEGTAQGVDFETFSQLDFIPADFLTFSYRFEVNGQTVAEIPFEYKSDLDLTQVPQPPQQGSEYGQWPQFPTRDLRRSLVLQAQFTAPTSTLSDQNGIAQLLVEGTFTPEAFLSVQEESLPAQEVGGCTAHAAWSYSVTGSQSDTLTIRLRADGVKKPAAALYQDGQWQKVDSTLDGSYLVFSGPVQGRVMLLEANSPLVGTILLISGTAALCLAAGIFFCRHRRHRTAKQAQT